MDYRTYENWAKYALIPPSRGWICGYACMRDAVSQLVVVLVESEVQRSISARNAERDSAEVSKIRTTYEETDDMTNMS